MTPLLYGLPESAVSKINEVFSRHPGISKVIIYGSRALGNYRNGSDIDLTIFSDDLNSWELGRIETELDDLLLPWKIDLSLFRQIDNADLREHIERAGTLFYAGMPSTVQPLRHS